VVTVALISKVPVYGGMTVIGMRAVLNGGTRKSVVEGRSPAPDGVDPSAIVYRSSPALPVLVIRSASCVAPEQPVAFAPDSKLACTERNAPTLITARPPPCTSGSDTDVA
jgi:hypothetical protein